MAQAWRGDNPMAARIYAWLVSRLQPAALLWLQTRGEAVAAGDAHGLYAAFTRVPRAIPRQDLCLSVAETAKIAVLVPGFDPMGWSLDQAARAWLLLTAPANDAAAYAALLEPLFRAAEVRELTGLCQSLPLLPHPAQHLSHAQEAVRSNMQCVFAAIALRNSYPAANFAEPAWNQMILKALFIGAPLAQVHGLHQRANPRLTRMLIAYARERRAARRPVPADLWRACAPYLDERDIDAVQAALTSEDGDERRAAALAVAASPALHRHAAVGARSH